MRARAAVRQALDTDAIAIRPAEAGRHVIAEFGLVPLQIVTGTMPEGVVTGARFQISEPLLSRSELSCWRPNEARQPLPRLGGGSPTAELGKKSNRQHADFQSHAFLHKSLFLPLINYIVT